MGCRNVRGPFSYVHERLGRSIESRVQTAAKLAADAHHAEIAQQRIDFEHHLADLRAHCDAECSRLEDRLRRQHRALTDVAEQIREIKQALEASTKAQRSASKAASTKISGLGQSIGATAASVTDSQRQAAALLEQIERRIGAVERLVADTSANVPDRP